MCADMRGAELMEAGAVVAVVRTLEQDIKQPQAWWALTCLIDKTDDGRSQALASSVLTLVVAALEACDATTQYQVLCTVAALTGSKSGAAAVAMCGVTQVYSQSVSSKKMVH